MSRSELPRVVVAGLAGDTGKSFVSLGLIRALRNRGHTVAPFKKGPDFIDAAWLGKAAGVPGRNLDTFMMAENAILASLHKQASTVDVAVTEGNRGLFDGLDAAGSHSTARLAKLIRAPVVLVVDVTKATRTVAAMVLGCMKLDPDLDLAGVILNRVGTKRQEEVIRKAVASDAGLPVLGAIPRLGVENLPSRHLGLVTACEHPDAEEALQKVTEAIERHVDVNAVAEIAGRAPALPEPPEVATTARPKAAVRIGVLRDKAFSFYYPENLESLQDAGAELCELSPLNDTELPELDALYAGGGFPEVHAADLSANSAFREALKKRIDQGLPVWAECGGLMYLSEGLIQEGVEHPMVGALPVLTEQMKKPQGHGYVQARVDSANPYLAKGTELSGHEFHYSRLKNDGDRVDTVLALERGVGLGNGRDGIRIGSVVASYTHLHALGTPQWAEGFIRAAAGGST